MKQDNQFDKNKQQAPLDKSKTVNAPLGGRQQPTQQPTGGAGINNQRKPIGGTGAGTTGSTWDKNK